MSTARIHAVSMSYSISEAQMRMGRLVFSIVGMLMLVGVYTARADTLMVALIDESGSMTQRRSDGKSRYEAAVAAAKTDVENRLTSLDGVSVYTFHDNVAVPKTSGFVSAALVVGAPGEPGDLDRMATSPFGGNTPLAMSMCEMIDVLVTYRSTHPEVTNLILNTYTDGGENSTPITHPCHGPSSGDNILPPVLGTWQRKVFDKVRATPNLEIGTTLFTNVSALAPKVILETATTPTLADLLSDKVFFAYLAEITGGEMRLVRDSEPLPVFADMNRDFCVDRSDAILLARKFGQHPTLQYDLNNDDVIDYDDYQILLSKMGQSCAQPDPYVASAPISCQGPIREIVLDGRVIEDGGIAIATRNSCKIIIKNSLIVSGQNAITIVGNAQVTVDNSIIVGEHATITLRGEATFSAANTIFHGASQVTGKINYVNRGGNTWE